MIITWHSLREKGKKKKHVVPHFFTLANAFFGFLAIIYALHNAYMVAIGCIMAAAVMDAIDGRVARMFGVSSSLGLELDSLCDAISFCLAPALILYCSHFADGGIAKIFVLALYLWCGLWRLARFNIASGGACAYFIGLPTPAAALFLMSLLASVRFFSASSLSFLTSPVAMLTIVALTALAMVSRIKFASFKMKKRMLPVVTALILSGIVLAGVGTLLGLPILFFALLGYIGWSAGVSLYQWVRTLIFRAIV